MFFVLGFGLHTFSQRSPIMNNPYYDTKPFHFGFLLGSNVMGFRMDMRDDYKDNDTLFGISPAGKIGFTVGIVSNLKLHTYWDLRFVPTISFGARSLTYFLDSDGSGMLQQTVKSIESTTVDFPLEFKWKGMRYRSLRPYVVGGVRYSLDMASNAKKKQNQDDIIVRLQKNDFLFTAGVGFDFYLPFQNKIAIELKMGFGMNDILIRENNVFTNGIARLSSKNLQLVITFE